jgi:hypothetical protein
LLVYEAMISESCEVVQPSMESGAWLADGATARAERMPASAKTLKIRNLMFCRSPFKLSGAFI